MKFNANLVKHGVMAVLSVALLASCGGGDQVEDFAPTRTIVFGDEASLLNTDGSKYTVNAGEFDTSVTPAVPRSPYVRLCTGNLVWTQQLAYSYRMSFTGCPGTGNSPTGLMYAAAGARAADVGTQVTSFLAANTFNRKDLVTVMAGTNDIIALYEGVADPAASSAALIAAAQAAGTEVGSQVVRITDRGAKVIVSTIPNVGLTPYAAAEEAANPGRAALLSAMSVQFNIRLRLRLEDVRDGGRAVGLILADELVQAMYSNPVLYGMANVTQPACATALPGCDITTLVAGAQAAYGATYLWADDRHLAQAAQSRIGSLAETRARNNPF